MSTKDDGGPAFPYSALAPDGPTVYKDNEGMSLRDWYAGMALQGMIASETQGDGVMPQFDPKETWHQRTATKAYSFADAMIAERNKP